MDKKTKELRSLSKSLEPTVQIGKQGITPGTITDIKAQLRTRKLIKIRLMPSKSEEKKSIAAQICEKADALLVDQIGNTISIARKE